MILVFVHTEAENELKVFAKLVSAFEILWIYVEQRPFGLNVY